MSHVDRFGNLITNLPFIWLAEVGTDWRERWSCAVGEQSFALVRTYSDARGTSAVALANSYDRMEIALARGNAAEVLGLARGAEVRFVPRRESGATRPKETTALVQASARKNKKNKQIRQDKQRGKKKGSKA